MSTDPVNRFLLTNLHARQKLCEMEYAALLRLIESPKTEPFERWAALERRDELMREWAKIIESLDLLAIDPPTSPVDTRPSKDPEYKQRKSWHC